MSDTVPSDIRFNKAPYRRIIPNYCGMTDAAQTYSLSAAGRVWLFPIDLRFTANIDRLGVAWVASQSCNFRLGLYEDAGDTPATGNLIVQTGSTAAGPNNRVQLVTVAETLAEYDLAWTAIHHDDLTAAWPSIRGSLAEYCSILGNNPHMCRFDQVYGALPDPCPAVTFDVYQIGWLCARVSDSTP